MATKLFVGNLDYSVNDQDLNELFSQAGTVASATVIINKFNNRSKGFGFVEMSSDEEAQAAVEKINGQELKGRAIVVNEARPREEGAGGFRGGSHGGSHGGYRGGSRGGYDR